MVNQLYINERLADLSGDTPMAINFQVNNLAELKDRQSTFSNSIKLPLTSNNKQIWGQAQADAFTQSQPYAKLNCKLVQNGIETIVNGTISLLNVSSSFECQITYGLIGLADALKKRIYDVDGIITDIEDAKLVDLDWSDIPPFSFDLPTIVASQSGTGVLWPVLDYGDTLDDSSNINITYLRPGIYYKDIFNRIEKFSGYTFSGGAAWASGFDDFIPFSDTILKDYLGNPSNGTLSPIGIVPNLPDFTLKNILKDYMQRYFLTPVVDNYKKTVVFHNYDEVYINKANAKDWTKKFVNEDRADTFEIGSYAQLNRLLFLEDSQEQFMFSAKGSFTIANENLDSDVDLVTSIFAGSDNTTKLGGVSVGRIRKYATSPLPNFLVPATEDTKPRVLHIGNAVVGARTFQSSTASQVAPFIQVATSRSYQYYIDTWGKGLLKMLKKARMITRYAVLTENDVKDFDFFTPVYDAIEGKFYYVNQISNFIPNKKTQVQLIRI